MRNMEGEGEEELFQSNLFHTQFYIKIMGAGTWKGT